jgi:hypothetical protein
MVLTCFGFQFEATNFLTRTARMISHPDSPDDFSPGLPEEKKKIFCGLRKG